MASRAPRNIKKQATHVYRKRADSAFRYKAFINGVLELDTPSSTASNPTPIVLTRKRRTPARSLTLMELLEWEFWECKPSTYSPDRPVLTRQHYNLDFTQG